MRWMKKTDVRPIPLRGNWIIPETESCAGHFKPPILSELPSWDIQTGHALVVTGLDEDNVYINAPAFTVASVLMPQGGFDPAWLAQEEIYATFTRRK